MQIALTLIYFILFQIQVGLLILTTCVSNTSFAQVGSVESIKKNSSQVLERTKDKIIVKNQSNFKIKDLIIFVRIEKKRFEIIARGRIVSVKSTIAIAEVDSSSVVKHPLKEDFVINVSQPYVAKNEKINQLPEPQVLAEPLGDPGTPGYIEFMMGNFSSNLFTQNSEPVNDSKQVGSYRFPYQSFTWFQEYFWRLGLEMESFNGLFPTSTYYRESVSSSESYSRLGIAIRSRRFYENRLRALVRIHTMKHLFETDNKDENLITTQISALGFGFQLEYEFNHFLWLGRSASLSVAPQNIFFVANITPNIKADDTYIQRGTSSQGSIGYDVRIGTNVMIYWRWLPIFKRWFLNFQIGKMEYHLKYNGSTTSDPIGVYKIPEGITSTESRSYMILALGFRFDDFLGKFFKPK